MSDKRKGEEDADTLSALNVKEISIVDRGAIDRPFLVKKRFANAGDTNMPTELTLTSAQIKSLAKSVGIISTIAKSREEHVAAALEALGAKDVTKSQVHEALTGALTNLFSADSDLAGLAQGLQDNGLLPGEFDVQKARGFDIPEPVAPVAADGVQPEVKVKAAPPENIAKSLVDAIAVVAPLLKAASKQDAAPSTQIDRVEAFLSKVAITEGMVTKGISAENVEKGFKRMTPARVGALKGAVETLGDLVSLFETGAPAEAPVAKSADAAGSEAFKSVLKAFETTLSTMNDRIETVEHIRKAAASEDDPKTTADVSKGAVDWGGII